MEELKQDKPDMPSITFSIINSINSQIGTLEKKLAPIIQSLPTEAKKESGQTPLNTQLQAVKIRLGELLERIEL